MEKIKEKKNYILAALLIMALIAGGVITGMKTMNIADAKDTGSKVATEKKDTKEEDKAKAKEGNAKKDDTKKEDKKADEDTAATSDTTTTGTTNNAAATGSTSNATAANNTAAAGGGNTYVAPAKQSSAPTTSTQPAKTQPAKPAHTHNWVPHYATRNVQKTVTVYEWYDYTACNDCGADVTGNPSSHSKWEVMENGRNGGWHIAQRQVPRQVTDTVQEKYVDYSYCSGCGATK